MRRTLEYFAAQFVLGTLRWLPLSIATPLARAYASMLDAAIPRLRRIAYHNLLMALPGADPKAIADGVFDSIGRLLLAFARLPAIDASNVNEWIRYEGLENFLEPARRGRGVLVATAHLGNWELSAFAHAIMTGPMNVVVRPLDNDLIDRIVESRRTSSGNRVIRKKEAARAVLRALSEGDAVGILIDQNASPEEGVFIDFFGIPACANAAFVKFAHRSGAAVVPGFALWSGEEKKYVLRFYPEVPMSGDVQADTQAVHTVLEAIIRRHPDQWLWIHRRWKTRPPGSPPLY